MEQKYDDQFKILLQGVQQILAAKPGNYLPVLGESINSSSSLQKQVSFLTHSRVDDHRVGSLILGKELYLKTDAIHQAVAKYFGLRVLDLKAVSRSRAVVLPRQIAIYLLRKNLGSSFKEIGKGLGINHHTTAMHAYRKISAAVEKDSPIKEVVHFIQNFIAD
jgi:chromosomal replication initiation ATPase DnaA